MWNNRKIIGNKTKYIDVQKKPNSLTTKDALAVEQNN